MEDFPFLVIGIGFACFGAIGVRHLGWFRLWVRPEDLFVELDGKDKKLLIAGAIFVAVGILLFLRF
jgi:hypothetical protein